MAQAVRDRTQGTGVAVAAPAKGGVLGLADGIVLDRDPRPVIDCIAKTGVGGHAAYDELVLGEMLSSRTAGPRASSLRARGARKSFGFVSGPPRPRAGAIRDEARGSRRRSVSGGR